MRRWSRLFPWAVVWGLLATQRECLSPVAACPACVGTTGPELSFVQQVVNCDLAVCALPTSDRRRFTLQSCFKGAGPPEGEIVLPVAELPQGRLPLDRQVVLGRETLTQRWKFLGTVAAGHQDWLLAIGRMQRTAELSVADWTERTRFFLGTLADDEPLVRETMVRELSRTPYAVMRACRADLDAGRLLQTLDPDRFPERKALVALLLGVAGGPTAETWLAEARSEAARRREEPARAALLVAQLEQEGVPGLSRFLRSEILEVSLRESERRAALLALSVQGTAEGVIPRSAVVAVYERILEQRPDLADRVAADLADWNEASLVGPLQRILDAGGVAEGARESIARALEVIRSRRQSAEYKTPPAK
ncbi:MAG: hypothetical protein ACK5UC_16625 [Planctomycetaceae bacterium]